ncbi:MAG: hypothetical protein KDN22_01380 [Verrucomicrobiae bacterium]|nr:hypothetical protein [Verrucomicrobiae bacterium]
MSARERLAETTQGIESGLDEIGINVESAQRFDEIQHFARHRLVGSFHAELKRLERGGRPQTISTHSQSRIQRFMNFIIMLPIVIAASLLNLPPLLAANEAGKKLADDRNVVSLFRVMAGSVAFGFWIPAAVTISAFAYGWAGAASYGIISLAGLCCWNCFKTTARALPERGLEVRELKPMYLREVR